MHIIELFNSGLWEEVTGGKNWEGEERKSYKLSLLGLLIVASCALHSVMEWNGILLVIQSRWELVSV